MKEKRGEKSKSMKSQLKELVTNETMKTLFPKIARIAIISLTICVSTASIKRSFSKMKLIKTCLTLNRRVSRNRDIRDPYP